MYNIRKKLSIVIINWNSGFQLKICLQSILKSTFEDYLIIIVDNCSTDGSLKLLPNSNKIQIIENSMNLGFGAACNQALRNINSDYILLLNPDTIINETTLQESIYFINKNKEIGIMGCKQVDEKGKTHLSCAGFPTFRNLIFDILGLSKIFPRIFTPAMQMTNWNHETSKYVNHVIGSYYFFRRSLIDKIGLLDEDFFVYLEDIDFSYRASKIGNKTYYNAKITIFHKGGGTSEQIKATRLYYSLHSRLIYAQKHFMPAEYIGLSILTCTIEPFTRIAYSLLKGQLKEVVETIQGYMMLYKKILF